MSTPVQRCVALLDTPPLRDFVIIGEPASKANSRRLVTFGKRPASIKSEKALTYTDAFRLQVPRFNSVIEDVLFAAIHIAYASERPDTDDSLIKDLLQGQKVKVGGETITLGAVIRNDRQIRHTFLTHSIDRQNPRTRIRLWQFT